MLGKILKEERIQIKSILKKIANSAKYLISKYCKDFKPPIFITVSFWSFIDRALYLKIHNLVSTKKVNNSIRKFQNELQALINKQKFSLTEFLIEKNINIAFHLDLNNNKLIDAKGTNISKYYKKYKELKEPIKAIIKLHNGLSKLSIKHVYFIPMQSLTKTQKTIGLFVVNSKSNYDIKTIELLGIIVQGYISSIHEFELEYLWQKYDLRSAVAAIMGRNMSHNIGSHVLNYLSNPDYFESKEDFWLTR